MYDSQITVNWVSSMIDTIKMATARELAEAGSLRETTVTAEAGGYVVTFALENSDRALATKDGVPRLFSGVEAAARVLAQLGITRYRVDATAIAGTEPSRRSRPDRSRALKQLHEDAAYLERIREAVAEARADSRPALSGTDAHLHMAALKARLGDELQTALKRRSSTK